MLKRYGKLDGDEGDAAARLETMIRSAWPWADTDPDTDIAIIAGGIGLGVLLTCFPSQTVLAAAKAHREREFDGGLFFSLLAAGLGVVILLVWLGHIIQGRHYDQALACLVLFFFVLAWDEWRRRHVQPTGSRDDRHRSRAL